ncbi:right-handed parallel beta-helix repeat-containing protein [Candidatus Sumerlaeota bacterium]|nr:right-handed parallel beta-helix repeat-containing protein [Candidatus Sumerlaeota bacterium]
MTRLILLTTLAVLAMALQGAHAQVHVSTLGSDTAGNGTESAPFLTLKRALQTGSADIRIENGDYIFDEPTVIPANVLVTGGYYRAFEEGSYRYYRSTQATNFLVNVQTPAFQAFPHPAAFRVGSGAQLQWVTIKGGYYSVQLDPNGRAFEIDFSGGITAAIYVPTSDVFSTAAFIERCRITGGGYGILVDRTGIASIKSTTVENALVRGIQFSGTGGGVLNNCVIQRSSSHGLFIQGSANVLVQNCVMRRNMGAGIYVTGAAPIIRGSLLEANSDGVFLDSATDTQVNNCTIAANRLNGIAVNKGYPDFSYNIIANNLQFGVAERVQEDVNGNPPPNQTGSLVSNLFWGNALGAYKDEGKTVLSTVSAIGQNADNTTSPTGTLIANPLFTDSAKSDFRLAKTSPALDVTAPVVDFDFDLDGNPRNVDVADIGASSPNTVDLGGYETQNSLRTRFATEFADPSSKMDPNHPGQTAAVLTNPRWIFDASSPFAQMAGRILPGRMRLFSQADMSYGGIGRTLTNDLTQSASQIAVVKAELQADDPSAVALPRIRINDIDKLDVTSSFFVLGRRAMTPPFTGRQYEFAYDIRQGQYADIPLQTKPNFHQSLSYDILDFFLFPYHSQHDLTALDVDFVDRATWNAQYTNLAKAWTFDPSETFDWVPGIAPPEFSQPFLSYDPGRGALRFEGFQDQSFAGWGSPVFKLPAGKRFRVECTIANGLSQELGPNFRIRIVSKLVDISYDVTCLTFPGGSATPSSTGSLYTVYGVAPDDPSLLVDGDKVEMYMAVELFGFAYVPGRQPHTIMYLDDVKIFTAP